MTRQEAELYIAEAGSDKNKRKAFEYMREHENVNVFDQQDLDEQLNG